MQRAFAYGLSIVLLGLVFAPAFREPWADDSFPLSTYPMFSRTRPRTMRVAHAVAVVEGARVPVSPSLVAGTSEVLQSGAVVRRALGAGRARRDRLCRRIASRVAADGGEALSDATAIELSVDTFDTLAYFEAKPEPARRRVYARCSVEGR